MEKFVLFWRDGKKETVEGDGIADAIRRAGYGGGALRALDLYASAENESDWVWDEKCREWKCIIHHRKQRSR